MSEHYRVIIMNFSVVKSEHYWPSITNFSVVKSEYDRLIIVNLSVEKLEHDTVSITIVLRIKFIIHSQVNIQISVLT